MPLKKKGNVSINMSKFEKNDMKLKELGFIAQIEKPPSISFLYFLPHN